MIILTFENKELLKLLFDKYFQNNDNDDECKNNIYYKYQNIKATQCTNDRNNIITIGKTIIETITSDGLETKNTIKNSDDYIIKNQTQSQEQYIITKTKFNEKYELLNNNDSDNKDDEWLLYKPKNNQIKGIKVNKEILNYLKNSKINNSIGKDDDDINLYQFNLIASWGEKMIFKENDYLVLPFNSNNKNTINNDHGGGHTIDNEIYRIANKEFNETYKLLTL